MSMLSATNLYCERDDRVLFSNLDFAVEAGQVWQITGANGSGKTTLLRLLSGLNQSWSGELQWKGQPRKHAALDFSASVFYLGHAPAIKKSLTARENLRWFCASQGKGDDAAISKALETFSLAGYEDFPVFQMSAGQQRRVSLARLYLTEANLWILDEPFTALDRRGVEFLEQFLAEHAAKRGTVILTTHHELSMPCHINVLDLDALAREAEHV